ncbi:MAG: sulfite exporter TauE/SafE family protein [Natronomonas sp.]
MSGASCTFSDPGTIGGEPVGLVVFFLVGLLGGAHCIGMCGPLVTQYATRMEPETNSEVLTVHQVIQHGLFNVGRGVSYTILGGLFGLAGSLAFVSARDVTLLAADVHAISGIVVGLVIVGIGVQYVVGEAATTIRVPGTSRIVRGMHVRVAPRLDAWVSDGRILGLGAFHGLLPCPLLYPAFLYAFIQGSPIGGAAALAALSAGTIPAVFLTGTLFQSVSPAIRGRLHRGLGVAFVVLGYIPLQHGLASLGVPLPHPPIPYFQPL